LEFSIFPNLKNITKMFAKLLIKFLASKNAKMDIFVIFHTQILLIFAIFGPIWTKFRSKELKILLESHFCLDRINLIGSTWSDWLDQIDSIGSTQSNQLNQINSIKSTQSNQLNQINSIKSTQSNQLNGAVLVQFGLNLGLNYLKFGQEAIFAVESTQLDQLDGSTWLDWLGQIDSIGSTWSDQINCKMASWPMLSCLGLNWFQIRPKMAKIGSIWVWKMTKMSILANCVDLIEN